MEPTPLQWGRRLWRRYRKYFDSGDDYWQTVALVWYRCLRKADPARPVERYFARSLVREFWNIGNNRLRFPRSLPEGVEGSPGWFQAKLYPDSLKELVADFGVVQRGLQEEGVR